MKLLLSTSAKPVVFTVGQRVAVEFDRNDWSVGTVLKPIPTGYRIDFDYGETKVIKTGAARIFPIDRRAKLKKKLSLAEVNAIKSVKPAANVALPVKSAAVEKSTGKTMVDKAGTVYEVLSIIDNNPNSTDGGETYTVRNVKTKKVTEILQEYDKPTLFASKADIVRRVVVKKTPYQVLADKFDAAMSSIASMRRAKAGRYTLQNYLYYKKVLEAPSSYSENEARNAKEQMPSLLLNAGIIKYNDTVKKAADCRDAIDTLLNKSSPGASNFWLGRLQDTNLLDKARGFAFRNTNTVSRLKEMIADADANINRLLLT